MKLKLTNVETRDITLKTHPKETHEESSRSQLKAGKILLVDDDVTQLELFYTFLKLEGYEVFPASSVRAALTMMAQEEISIIVTDVMMPDVNGIEFIDMIKARSNFSDTPIVLMTAGRSDLEQEGLDAGADMFCPKRQILQLLPKQLSFLLQNSYSLQ